MGVFDAAPVASSPPGTPDNAGGGGGGGGGDGVGPAERRKPRLIGGNLMAWLEEYLRCGCDVCRRVVAVVVAFVPCRHSVEPALQ